MEMDAFKLRDLSSGVVQSVRNYGFVAFRDLSAAELNSLGPDVKSTAFTGVLMSSERGGGNMKAVSQETAELFLALEHPVSVDRLLTNVTPKHRDEVIARLILEGIVSIDGGAGFMEGYSAYPLLFENAIEIEGSNRIGALSLEAVRHGYDLELTDPNSLSARLYFYNRVPATRAWKELWLNDKCVLEYLGLAPGGLHRLSLHTSFKNYSGADPQWLFWKRRGSKISRTAGGSRYKLYVSPEPSHLLPAVGELLSMLPESGATSFKVGMNAYGLLRPDKIVIYFDDAMKVRSLGDKLAHRLYNLPAQGVPFSSQLDKNGMLSWGVDPLGDQVGVGWHNDDSWRIWVSNRIALALIAARSISQPCSVAVRYALAGLWLSGVDIRSWTPRTSFRW